MERFRNARSETKLAGEYCWAITQAAGRSCCGQSGSTVLVFAFKLGCRVYRCLVDHMCTLLHGAAAVA
jgi:hypothetical protein